jgi:hypothetical protein
MEIVCNVFSFGKAAQKNVDALGPIVRNKLL